MGTLNSLLMRVLARERGVFAGAIVVAAACGALGVPIDFVLFGLTLAGVGLFHHHAMQVALSGLTIRQVFSTFARSTLSLRSARSEVT